MLRAGAGRRRYAAAVLGQPLPRRWPQIVVATVLLAVTRAPIAAEEQSRLDVPTLPSASIHLDGSLDEPAWQQAAVIDGLTQHEPHPGEATEFPTQIRVFTDGASIYLGYDCRDPEPDKIAIHSLQRDGNV